MTAPTVFTNLESKEGISTATGIFSSHVTVGGNLSVAGSISEAGTQKVKTVEIGYIDKETATATAKELWTLPIKCAILQVFCIIDPKFEGSTDDAIILGTADNDDEFLAAADVTEGTAGLYSKTASFYAAAATKIYATYTRTGTTTAGKATFYVTYVDLA